jgi:hypothetical protein
MGRSIGTVLALALAAPAILLPAPSRVIDRDLPMRFELYREGPEKICGTHCRTLVSASGSITADTARAFSRFAQGRDLSGALVVLDSDGGSVHGAMALGRAIRNHADFKPKGTNVNFVEIKNQREIAVRTYERGVENETLACGTGSTASAVVSSLLGYAQPPVKVRTAGGEVLTVDFKREGDKITRTTLEGETRFVYDGQLFAANGHV